MPKTDFETSVLSDISETLVVPKIRNDPYSGAYRPDEGAVVAAILEDISSACDLDVAAYRVEGPLQQMWGLRHKHLKSLGYPVHREAANLLLPLSLLDPDENGNAYEVYDIVGRIRDAGENADRVPTVRREFDEYAFATNLNGQPTSPRIDVLDTFVARTFIWAAGKRRTSKDGRELDSVYNPTPHTIAVMASVSIRFADLD